MRRTQDSVRQFRWIGLVLLAAGLAPVPPAMAQVAGSVDAGLQELAGQIVRKSTDAARTKIAVLPFPNADKSCSVLSTYIVDELTLALFSVPNSPLTIVERSQLEALINELSIGEGGLLNPETTKELGKISGVQALVVGTITIIGDTLRVNSRLVGTETGQTISAAAVSIPKTAAVTDLLGQRVACSTVAAGPSSGGRGSRPITPPGGGSVEFVPPALPQNAYRTGDLAITVQNASRGADKKSVNLVVGLTNTGKEPLQVMFVGPQPLLLDDQGNEAKARSVAGLGICQSGNGMPWESNSEWCARTQASLYSTLAPQSQVTVVMRFAVEDQVYGDHRQEQNAGADASPALLSGSLVSFSSRVAVRKGEKEKPEGYTISMPSIPLR